MEEMRYEFGNDCLQVVPNFMKCKLCGLPGLEDAFYSKEKQICSLTCYQARCSVPRQRAVASKTVKKTVRNVQQHRKMSADANNGMPAFSWVDYIAETHSAAVPVNSFKHCVLADEWDCIDVGVKVEVLHHDSMSNSPVYWIATIVNVAGYHILLRYEGCGDDSRCDFWVNILLGDVHRVGWCATSGHALVTPEAVRWRRDDWKQYLVEQLTGAQTLSRQLDESKSQSTVPGLSHSTPCLPIGAHIEVVDKTCISAMSVATVMEVTGGRLHLRYVQNNERFWCHTLSSLVHPLGWSLKVGHCLHANQDIMYDPSTTGANLVTSEMFAQTKTCSSTEDLCFLPGMKLEAIDPLNLSTICVATVTKVLGDGYMMVGIDGSMAMNGSDWFCYHASSPCIFPAGFCKINNLELTPPRGFVGIFDWCTYLRDTNSVAAPVALFDKEIPLHGFQIGMKVEAADLMDPKLICVATVVNVVGRLLRIHFDGWESTYDQYLDCLSPDIYPVGWCDTVGHALEPPPFCSGSGTETHSSNRMSNVSAAKRKRTGNGVNRKQDRKKGAIGFQHVSVWGKPHTSSVHTASGSLKPWNSSHSSGLTNTHNGATVVPTMKRLLTTANETPSASLPPLFLNGIEATVSNGSIFCTTLFDSTTDAD